MQLLIFWRSAVIEKLLLIIGRLNKNAFPNVEERGHFVADDQKINDFLQKKKINSIFKELFNN